jgi:hypothetical protein
MKLFFDQLPEVRNPDSVMNVLQSWYDSKPAVQRLWAIESRGAGGDTELRVIVMLEPSPDSDEVTPIWMARGAQWVTDLRHRVAVPMRLEWTEVPWPDTFDVDGQGLVRSVHSWRHPTLTP